ncbi:MAG: tetratricopeptide repeat protein [Oligoflexia bacterium]|nr:tetratricopeptide repeat protein [Oligoflexia bacterium]
MHLGYPRHGLRVTVRLGDAVVSQRVVWAPPVVEFLALSLMIGLVTFALSLLASSGVTVLDLWTPLVSQLAVILLAPTGMVLAITALAWPRSVELGGTGADAVPTADGEPLGRVLWTPGKDPVFVDHGAGDVDRLMPVDSRWSWRFGDIDVDISGQPRDPARRLPTDPLGDVGMVVVALGLYVGLLQARLFVDVMPAQGTAGDMNYRVSPELIARLLQRDLDGADQGAPQRADRPDYRRSSRGPYLPAGGDGPLNRAGGGANQGPMVVRTPPPEDETLPQADKPPAELTDALALDQSVPALDPLGNLPGDDDAIAALDEYAKEMARPSRARDAIERFIGWGFRDWFDAVDKQEKLDPRVERQLQLARRRLRLDPDDYGALAVVGEYAYLAENIELSRSSYQRLIELYPDDTAGYNNLALTYKRDGLWDQEEALYRMALALNPLDIVVLNNLAVNLAHQDRYNEALAVMAALEELDPDDPYSDLHRAKVFAAMGKRERVYKYLRRALDGVDQLDSLHHIEFRQDLRLEPLFAKYRREPRFRRLLRRAYGPDADALLRAGRGDSHG